MMNATQYRHATMPEGSKASDAKAQRKADAAQIVKKGQSCWLTALLFTINEVQATALARTDGQVVPGIFELVGTDVARVSSLGKADIRLMSFVAELTGDAVRATIDLWESKLIEQETIGATEASDRQVAFLMRGKYLRTCKNTIGKLKKYGFVTKGGADIATNYEHSLKDLLFSSDIKADSFPVRLLATAQGFDHEADASTVNHRIEQYSLYVTVLGREERRERALGSVRFNAKADAAVLERINGGEIVFAKLDGSILQFDATHAVEQRIPEAA